MVVAEGKGGDFERGSDFGTPLFNHEEEEGHSGF